MKEGKFKNLKEKAKNVFSNVKEKVSEEETSDKGVVKPIVTSRVLFVSILHKLFFISFVVTFVLFFIAYWQLNVTHGADGLVGGYFSSIISKIFSFGLLLFGGWIYYLILNWLYKCVSKTMICLTEKEIYGEMYAPFYRGEFSVPIENVTKVDTVKILWIFRFIMIHRYHQVPIIFATWNAQAFKDELVKLLTERKEKVANEFKNMDILPNWIKNKKKIFIIIFVAVLVLMLTIYTVKYINNPYRKIPGTYKLDNNSIVLNEDGTCEISKDIIGKEALNCSWLFEIQTDENIETIPVSIEYQYKYSSRWYTGTYNSDMELEFNVKEKQIVYNEEVYSKEN